MAMDNKKQINVRPDKLAAKLEQISEQIEQARANSIARKDLLTDFDERMKSAQEILDLSKQAGGLNTWLEPSGFRKSETGQPFRL